MSVIDRALRYYLSELREVEERSRRGKSVSSGLARDLGVGSPSELPRVIQETMDQIRRVDELRNHVQEGRRLIHEESDFFLQQWHGRLQDLVK